MAAQLRSVVPHSPSFPCLLPPGSSTSRITGLAHNKGTFHFTFSARSASGKHPSAFSASAFSSSSPSSPSAIATDRYVAPELGENGGNGGGSFNGHGGDGGGGDNYDNNGHGGHSHGDSAGKGGFLGAFLKGWNERVSADPQFPFKVLMEEVVGVGACVIGDMASRPNFGLNELDFVFSTIVVGSILNFSLMYMLAPTSAAASAAASTLPAIFASCPPGHMFEQGAYSVLDRLGTFVYKGAVFATVGFAAGLLGTVISNLLIGMRKKMDPSFESQNKAPPTVLNAATWAIHMGLSSNLRYQAVNGLEFAMANVLPTAAFKVSVLCTRTLNNVLGGMSFVALARLTGSQKAEAEKAPMPEVKELEASTIQAKESKVSTSEPTPTDKATTTEADATKEVGLTSPKEDDAPQ